MFVWSSLGCFFTSKDKGVGIVRVWVFSFYSGREDTFLLRFLGGEFYKYRKLK